MFITENRQFYKLIIVTTIVTHPHDVLFVEECFRRFPCSMIYVPS
jgi:hypothetical protein